MTANGRFKKNVIPESTLCVAPECFSRGAHTRSPINTFGEGSRTVDSRLKRAGMTAIVLCIFISNLSFAEQPNETPTDLSKQTMPGESYKLHRLGDDVANILYGPLEIVNQFRQEIKLSDPIRGFVPGIIRGFAWFGMREAAGISEIATFYVPAEPPLEPFDTSWLRA